MWNRFFFSLVSKHGVCSACEKQYDQTVVASFELRNPNKITANRGDDDEINWADRWPDWYCQTTCKRAKNVAVGTKFILLQIMKWCESSKFHHPIWFHIVAIYRQSTHVCSLFCLSPCDSGNQYAQLTHINDRTLDQGKRKNSWCLSSPT